MYTNFDYQKEKLTKGELADYLAYKKFDTSLDCYETILKMLDEEYKGNINIIKKLEQALKHQQERYDKMSDEEFFKPFKDMGIELTDTSKKVCCETCKNNPMYNDGYRLPHTCDICTSLDQDDYCMWERRE